MASRITSTTDGSSDDALCIYSEEKTSEFAMPTSIAWDVAQDLSLPLWSFISASLVSLLFLFFGIYMYYTPFFLESPLLSPLDLPLLPICGPKPISPVRLQDNHVFFGEYLFILCIYSTVPPFLFVCFSL